jgi:hypothetical protein
MKFYKDSPIIRAAAKCDQGFRLLLEDEVMKGIPANTEYTPDSGLSWSAWPEGLSRPGQPIAPSYYIFHFRTRSPLPAEGGLESLLR